MRPESGDTPSTAGTRVWLPADVPPQLGEYRLLQPLDKGGMGMVFEASHVLLEQRFAVKVLRPELAADPHFVGRFRREMAAQGKVPAHPHMVRATYAG